MIHYGTAYPYGYGYVDPIGPRWEYVNPQGCRFFAFSGADVAILRRAADLSNHA